jgi:hypothetical protein
MQAVLRQEGFTIVVPRELRLVADVRARAAGLPPQDRWPLHPSLMVLWLPAMPVC